MRKQRRRPFPGNESHLLSTKKKLPPVSGNYLGLLDKLKMRA
jgi:hypothetical protein